MIKTIHILAVLAAILTGVVDAHGQTSKARGRKAAATAAAPKTEAVKTPAPRERSEFEMFMLSVMKNAFVVVRQDYHLVDDDEGEVKTADGKDYWGRSYSMGVRTGDSDYLISGDAVKPWVRDGLPKATVYRPEISRTAVRSFEAVEFEPWDFDADGVSELREKRLYTAGGSEEPGLTVAGFSGPTRGYAVWAVPSAPVVEGADTPKMQLVIAQASVNFNDSRTLYDCDSTGAEKAFGGVYVVPVCARPGCVDFCVAGVFQRVGGVWRLVSVSEGTELKSTASADASGDILGGLISDIDAGMQEFLCEIGLQ